MISNSALGLFLPITPAAGVGGDAQFAFDFFQVKPPFVFEFGFNVTEKFISPNREIPGKGEMPHGPLNKAMEGGVRFVPGANRNAHTTAGAFFIANALAGAFFHIG